MDLHQKLLELLEAQPQQSLKSLAHGVEGHHPHEVSVALAELIVRGAVRQEGSVGGTVRYSIRREGEAPARMPAAVRHVKYRERGRKRASGRG